MKPHIKTEMTMELLIAPKTKARHRSRAVTTKDGRQFVQQYNPEETKLAETNMKAQMAAAWSRPYTEEPVEVEIVFYMPKPKSWPRWREMVVFLWPHISTPDLDNLEKQVMDAGNMLIWKDDRQVFRVIKSKLYSDHARIIVTVKVWRYPTTKAEAEHGETPFSWE